MTDDLNMSKRLANEKKAGLLIPIMSEKTIIADNNKTSYFPKSLFRNGLFIRQAPCKLTFHLTRSL